MHLLLGDVHPHKVYRNNKFSQLETNIDWKEAVATYNDIARLFNRWFS